jgi:hypothetical protein
MLRKKSFLSLLVVFSFFFSDSADARRFRRSGFGAQFVRVRFNPFGFFGRNFFPFESNAINPFDPFFSLNAFNQVAFRPDILGGSHDFGPNQIAFQNAFQQSISRPVANFTPTVADSSAPASGFRGLLEDAVRARGFSSVRGSRNSGICDLADRYASELSALGGLNNHAGFSSVRFPALTQLGFTSGSEIIAENNFADPVQAAESCVTQWQNSSNHLPSMAAFHDGFCYAMAQNNGKFFCVGLFGN